ncbi:MAG: MOSC domain-containing protein [Chthoniobacterales bacterium]
MIIQRIFISPGHNFFGHAGREPDEYPLEEVERIECVAGHGLRGDRFYDFKKDYQGQITFFSAEVFAELGAAFPHVDKSPGVLRRNVLVAGADLNALIGKNFELQGVRFAGTAHCAPCFWMERAFAPGAEAWLRNRGGLRARILSDGWLEAAQAPAEALVRP